MECTFLTIVAKIVVGCRNSMVLKQKDSLGGRVQSWQGNPKFPLFRKSSVGYEKMEQRNSKVRTTKATVDFEVELLMPPRALLMKRVPPLDNGRQGEGALTGNLNVSIGNPPGARLHRSGGNAECCTQGIQTSTSSFEPFELPLFSDDLYENPFFPPPVKLSIENLLPRPKIELSSSNSDHDFPAHDLSLHMGIRVVFSGVVMAVGRYRLVWSKLFQPRLIVSVQPGFVIVDEDRRRDVHGVDKKQAFLNSTLPQALHNLRCDVQQGTTRGNLKPKLFAVALHEVRGTGFERRLSKYEAKCERRDAKEEVRLSVRNRQTLWTTVPTAARRQHICRIS